MIRKFSSFLSKYMALIVLAVAALALLVPQSCLWIQTSWVNPLLMVVMFGMGLTLRLEDFRIVFTRPKDILVGFLAQFTIMPLLAYLLSLIFQLDAGLMAGVILVGTCPGGTSSNVMTYLAGGDVALSVGMTSVNTLLAPLLTPLISWLLLQTTVTVDIGAMFLSILQVVLIPIALGLILNAILGKKLQPLHDLLPCVSVIAITLIVATVVSHNAAGIMSTGAIVFVVVILHNLLGYLCGYGLAAAMKLPLAKKKALSIEIGMQNSGLATSLAGSAFPDLAMATVPGAIFSVWHNISGALLASWFRRKEK